MKNFWKTFLTSNKTKYRLARTIVQGILASIVAYLDVIVGMVPIPNELRPLIVAIVMAILSPIMSELGASIEANDRASKMQFTTNTDSLSEMVEGADEEENSMSSK